MPPQTLVAVVAAELAQHTWPLRLPAWTRPLGWATLLAGLSLVTLAVRERGPGPLDEPDSLVTRGAHARSRNPMYLGISVAQVGLAGARGNVWMLASTPASAMLLDRSIRREERWLHRRFGPAYDTYRADVPRWWSTPCPPIACATFVRTSRSNTA